MSYTSSLLLNSSGVFALVLIIAGNYLSELFNVNLRSILAHPLAKHIVALLTLYFFVVLLDDTHIGKPLWQQGLVIVLLYCVFLMLIKTEGRLTILSLCLLGVLYFLHKWEAYRRTHNLPISETAQHWLQSSEIVVGVSVLCSLVFGVFTYIGFHLTNNMTHKQSWSWWNFFIDYDQRSKMCDDISWGDYGHYAWLGLKLVTGNVRRPVGW